MIAENPDDTGTADGAPSGVIPIPIRTAQPDRGELSAGVDEVSPRTPTGGVPNANPEPVTDAPSTGPRDPAAAPPDDALPPPATRRGGKRFQIPKRGGARDDVLVEAGAGAGAGGDAAARQAPAWSRALYHGVDALLELIHRPFVRIPHGVRNIIGGCAAATIVVSVTAMYALPALFPRHDAIDFLAQRMADLNRPKPEPRTVAHEELDDPAAPTPASGGH